MIQRPGAPSRAATPDLLASVATLSAGNRAMLRDLGERTLEALGIKETAKFLDAEMERHLAAIAAVGDVPDKDKRIRVALRAALDQTL